MRSGGSRSRDFGWRRTGLSSWPGWRWLSASRLRFILANPDVSTIIPGMRKLKNVESNIAASDGKALPADLITKLRAHRWDRRPTHWSQ